MAILEHNELPTVVDLNHSTSDRIVFCLHTAGGGIGHYRDCAAELAPDIKLYGLDDPYLLDDYEYGSIPELAEYHVQTIQEMQPAGPYLLMGYCSGGPLAYEVACQLSMSGQKVERLALMGSELVLGFDAAEVERYGFLKDYLLGKYSVDLSHMDWVDFEGRDIDDVSDALTLELQRLGYEEALRNPQWVRKGLSALSRARHATKRYRPPRADFDIDLYRRDLPSLARSIKPWCDWSRITSRTLSVVEVPKVDAPSHGDILFQPYLTMTAATLRKLTL